MTRPDPPASPPANRAPPDRRSSSVRSAEERTFAERDAASFADAGGAAGLITEGGGLHRLLVESVSEYAIFALDATGHVLSWNIGARRIKGYEAHEIIGRHFSTFYLPPDLASGKPAWELEVAIRDGRFEEEGWRLRKDGSTFWANVVITSLWDDERTLVGFAKVTRDLTERRAAAERAIADARRIAEAEGANRAKSEFLATMSHELRTPLNAIGGYVELMQLGIAGPVTPKQLEYLARVRGNQEHLLSIINDLLNYSRIEGGHVSYEIVAVRLEEMIVDVRGMIEPQTRTKGLVLEQTGELSGLTVLADRLKTEQILVNLLSNAVKFTPTGGRITIECRRVGETVEVHVRDTGLGIPLDKQGAIFEPFVQLGRNPAAPGEGTGLGLAISRDLAQAMGGDVTVQSEPGVGSTFTLSLQCARDPVAPGAP
jgi:PAS domain S-box-containing protein